MKVYLVCYSSRDFLIIPFKMSLFQYPVEILNIYIFIWRWVCLRSISGRRKFICKLCRNFLKFRKWHRGNECGWGNWTLQMRKQRSWSKLCPHHAIFPTQQSYGRVRIVKVEIKIVWLNIVFSYSKAMRILDDNKSTNYLCRKKN